MLLEGRAGPVCWRKWHRPEELADLKQERAKGRPPLCVWSPGQLPQEAQLHAPRTTGHSLQATGGEVSNKGEMGTWAVKSG